MSTLEDDIRAVMHSQADAMHVPEPHLSTSLSLERVTTHQRPQRRWMLAAAAVVPLVAIAGVVLAQRRTHEPAAETTTISNGWVAFAGGDPDSDIYLVREGSPAHRIAGTDTDGLTQVCPAFSPDGTRLMYAQAKGDSLRGQDPALVITDLTADGTPSATATIALEGTSLQPCAKWSADGRWVAFGAGTLNREADPLFVDEVWVLDTETNDIRRLSGLTVTDIDWAPDSTELFIANDGRIEAYSVATDDIRPLDDTSGVRTFTVSPDGQHIAFERLDPNPTTRPTPRGETGPLALDLWVIDADGTDERILAADFNANHGIGPVWSPDGDHIAYQRLCDYKPPPSNTGICFEDHEVVVVTVTDTDPLEPAGTQLVIPPPETAGPNGTTRWYPDRVTWSPDSTTLLYGAWNDQGGDGLIAVPVDGETSPVVLDDTLGLSRVLVAGVARWSRPGLNSSIGVTNAPHGSSKGCSRMLRPNSAGISGPHLLLHLLLHRRLVRACKRPTTARLLVIASTGRVPTRRSA